MIKLNQLLQKYKIKQTDLILQTPCTLLPPLKRSVVYSKQVIQISTDAHQINLKTLQKITAQIILKYLKYTYLNPNILKRNQKITTKFFQELSFIPSSLFKLKTKNPHNLLLNSFKIISLKRWLFLLSILNLSQSLIQRIGKPLTVSLLARGQKRKKGVTFFRKYCLTDI